MDFNSYALAEWKAQGSPGDFYEWLNKNESNLRASWSNTQSGYSYNTFMGEDPKSKWIRQQYDKFLLDKYGVDSSGIGKVGPDGRRRVYKTGTTGLDKNDTFDAWLKREGASLDAGWDEQRRQFEKEQQRRSITEKIAAFYAELEKPVQNPDGTYRDPLAKQLVQSGVNVAEAQAARRGIGGPLGGTAAMVSAQTALQPWLAQREQLKQNTLALMNQRDISNEQLEQGAYALDLQAQQMANQNAMASWAAGKNQAQGIGAGIGTGIGVGLGALLSPYTGGASMTFMPAIGGAIGGGIGGAVAGQGPSLATPNSYSGRGSSSWRSGKGGW